MEEGQTFLMDLKESWLKDGVPEPDPGWGLEEKLKSYLKALEEEYRLPSRPSMCSRALRRVGALEPQSHAVRQGTTDQ